MYTSTPIMSVTFAGQKNVQIVRCTSDHDFEWEMYSALTPCCETDMKYIDVGDKEEAPVCRSCYNWVDPRFGMACMSVDDLVEYLATNKDAKA